MGLALFRAFARSELFLRFYLAFRKTWFLSLRGSVGCCDCSVGLCCFLSLVFRRVFWVGLFYHTVYWVGLIALAGCLSRMRDCVNWVVCTVALLPGRIGLHGLAGLACFFGLALLC